MWAWLTLEIPVWGNVSKDNTTSSPGFPCDCPMYALVAANVGTERPSPRNIITLCALPVRGLKSALALRRFCAASFQKRASGDRNNNNNNNIIIIRQ
jgi:hypothetical protein